jgi:Family of unknown function (DUF5678)
MHPEARIQRPSEGVANMAAAAVNFSDILKDVPPGAWAAVWNYHVLAYGADMQQVLAEARSKGVEHPIIVKVPDRPEMLFF